MRKILFATLAAGAALAASPAVGRQHCGIGGHRDWRGWCVPNGPRLVAGPPVPLVGIYYSGSGWWDGHRYWRDRYYSHHRWRYR